MALLIANISNADSTRNKIKTWTGDVDNIVAINYQVGHWTTFSNTVFKHLGQTDAAPIVNIAYDPPGEELLPTRGPSQHTYFENETVDFDENPQYGETAVNYFASLVLADYLQTVRFIVKPTQDVQAALGGPGNFPYKLEDIARMVQKDPKLLEKVERVEETFTPQSLSAAARYACRLLLHSRADVNAFLEDPEKILSQAEAETGEKLTEAERNAFVQARDEQPDVIRYAFDHVELGQAPGDGNTYILIGVDPELKRPRAEWAQWATDQLEICYELNGFWPAYGPFVTEAHGRFRVVLGPGVTEREIGYLQFAGIELIDRTDGADIGLLDDPHDAAAR